MADNVPITAGAGTSIATDDVAGVHYQQIKLHDGTLNSSTPIAAANGLAANAIRVTVASDSTGQIDVTDRALRDMGKIDVVDITGTISLPTGAATAALQLPDGHNVTVDNGAGAAAVNIQDGGNAITVDGTVTANAGTNLNTSALSLEATQGSVKTAVELIDDSVATLGTTTYLEATTKGLIASAIRRDADTSAVNTDNEAAPLLVNAIGALKVEAFSGETLPVSLTSTTITGTVAATQSGTWTVQPGNTQNTTPWLAAIHDGTTLATVRNLAANDALNVAIVDGTGTQITTFGGGTQYTEADTDASITGTAVMWEDAADTLRAVSSAKPLPVNVVAGGAAGGTSANDDSAFTIGSQAGTPIMGLWDDTTPDSVDENDVGVVRMSANRNLFTTLRDAAGNERGVNVTAGNALTVDGSAVTQPVSAVNLDIRDLASASDSVSVLQATASNLNATVVGTGTFAAQVTGSVTANAGTNLNTSALSLEATQGSVKTAVELIDDTVATLGTTTYTEAATKGLIIGAIRRDADTTLVDTTNEVGPLQMDANGRLKVEAFSGEALPVTLTSTTITGTVAVTQSGTWDEVGINDSGNAITVDWAGTAPPIGAGLEATALRVTVATDSTGVLSVDDNGAALTVDNGGTFAVQATAVGTVADDSPTPGVPQMIGGQAKNFDGTAPGNVSAEDDVVIAIFDRNRRQYVNTIHPEMWSYHENSSSALTDTSVAGAPGVNEALFVTDIVVSTGAATALNIFFEEGASTVLGPYYLEAIAGRGFAIHFNTPKKITTNTALTVTTSAAIAHAIDVTGFVARVD